ncbi:shikimate dehydrogenase [soil metagenome]
MTAQLIFLGVTTAGSQILRLFPEWADLLGLDAKIVGRDLPLAGPPEVYRRAVEELRDEPSVAGALVTTHKVAVQRYAGDLFSELDRWAWLCGEISCISKRDGRLIGHALDPITSGMAMSAIIAPGYWGERPGAGVLCMGAGGAGTAITAHLLAQPHRPGRIVITSRRPEPLEALRAIGQGLGGVEVLDPHMVASEEHTDALLASMAPGSLVINATGAGKDRPGSPISGRVPFPEDAIAWDLNYRGDLGFLVQARRELPASRIHDGWRYFIHGWTEVIGEVFGIEMAAERLAVLADAAEPFRPTTPT